ncbi:MAG TPA: hypothetical protein VGF75_04290 [Candidatus Saccharimonadales bacterium]|jgi:hypothetical protein
MTQPGLFETGQPQSQPELDMQHVIEQIAAAGARREPLPQRVPSEAAVDQGWGVVTDLPKPESKPSPEDLFMDRKYDWIPRSKGEVNMALSGLEHTLRTKDTYGGLSGVEKSLQQTHKFLSESRIDLGLLSLALKDRDDRSTFNPSLARGDVGVLQVLANHQLFANALVQHRWPRLSSEPTKRKLLEISMGLRTADDQTIQGLWNGAVQSAAGRINHWQEQENLVVNNPRVEESYRESRHRVRQ